MTLIAARKLGISLTFTCSLASVYFGFSGDSGRAQTAGAGAGSTQKQVPARKPAVIAPNAHPPAAAAAAARTPPPGKDGIYFDESQTDGHTGITKGRNWIYTRSDTVISGTTAKYDRNADTLDTSDPIVMNDPKHHLTADSAHVEHAKNDPGLRLVILTGHAVMVLKPQETPAPGQVPPAAIPGPGSAASGGLKVVSISSRAQGDPPQPQKKESTSQTDAAKGAKPPAEDKDREDAKAQQRHGGTATCDKIEYKTKTKFATLTGHVVFKQSFLDKDGKLIERTMTCEHAEYDGISENLHLFKPVHFESNDGQVFDSPDDAKVGTKVGEETLALGHGELQFTTPDEDEDTDNSRKANAKEAGSKDSRHKVDN